MIYVCLKTINKDGSSSESLDLIERIIKGKTCNVVRYKKHDYIVWGGPGRERIHVEVKAKD